MSSSSSSAANLSKLCGNLDCKNKGVHLCSGCGEEVYCSAKCQRDAWGLHRDRCKDVKATLSQVSDKKSFEPLSSKQLRNILKAKAIQFKSKDERKVVIDELDTIVEKSDLITLVSKHVKFGEVESLLSSSTSWRATEVEGSSGVGSSSSGNGVDKKSLKKATKKNGGGSGMPVLTAAQLREQAKLMRNNPGLVRSQNKVFANMTDAQIREHADQLERTAKNPQLMADYERMARLSAEERDQLIKLQGGFTGEKAMDSAWIDDVVRAIKDSPSLFKTLFHGRGAVLAGASDDQIEGFIDMASRMEPWLLKIVVGFFVWIGKIAKPVTEWFTKIDKATLGLFKYVLALLLLVVLYYVFSFVYTFLRIIVRFFYGVIFGSPKVAAAAGATAGGATFNNVKQQSNDFKQGGKASIKDTAQKVRDMFRDKAEDEFKEF